MSRQQRRLRTAAFMVLLRGFCGGKNRSRFISSRAPRRRPYMSCPQGPPRSPLCFTQLPCGFPGIWTFLVKCFKVCRSGSCAPMPVESLPPPAPSHPSLPPPKPVVFKVGSPDPRGSTAHCQGVRGEFARKYVQKTD